MLMLLLLTSSLITLGENQDSPVLVDVVEINTYGNHGAKQIILRQWSDSPHGVGHWITDWRSVVDCETTRHGDRTRVRFVDSVGNAHELTARSYRETRTANDIEVMERKLYPEENRIPQLR